MQKVNKGMRSIIFLTAAFLVLLSLEGQGEPVQPPNVGVKENLTSLGKPPGNTAIIPESLIFSQDAANVAYVASITGKGMLVCVNGKQGKLHNSIGKGSLMFSPRTNRIAYIAVNGNKMRVVTDYHEGPLFDGVANVTFSPDGSRMAYRAQEGKKQFVVAGGGKSREFDGISGKMGLMFSPNSKHMAAVAVEGTKQVLILNGRY